MVPYRTIWYHIVPYATIWYHMIPYGTIWYHMIPYLALPKPSPPPPPIRRYTPAIRSLYVSLYAATYTPDSPIRSLYAGPYTPECCFEWFWPPSGRPTFCPSVRPSYRPTVPRFSLSSSLPFSYTPTYMSDCFFDTENATYTPLYAA